MTKYYFSNRDDKTIITQLLSLSKLISFFKKECGVYAYICYGTLLGAIRNNDVIPEDTDYDISYLSNGTTLQEVRKEYINICETLLKHNLLTKIWSFQTGIVNPSKKDLNGLSGQMHVKTPDGLVLIDVFTSWINKGNYHLSPHIHGDLKANIIVPFRKDTIRNISFIIPNKSDILLQFLYGEDWIIPKNKKSKKKQIWLNQYE